MKSKIVKCIDCGDEQPRKELNRSFRCVECRMTALRDNMVQLRKHKGPAYDKWRTAMQAASSRL